MRKETYKWHGLRAIRRSAVVNVEVDATAYDVWEIPALKLRLVSFWDLHVHVGVWRRTPKRGGILHKMCEAIWDSLEELHEQRMNDWAEDPMGAPWDYE